MIIELTILELGLAFGIIVCLIAFLVDYFRLNVLYQLYKDMSNQVDHLVEYKERPDIHMVRAWREGLANSKKNSAAWHAYRNRLNEYGLL